MWLRAWLFLLLLLQFVHSQQRIVEGPTETFVHLGKTIVLRCKVENQKGAVQWMKNGFGLGVDRALKFFPRYSMIGSAALGEFHLQIVNTTAADDDIYACQLSEAEQEPSQVSAPAKLTVLVRPSPPRLVSSEVSKGIGTAVATVHAIAGEPVRASCVSSRGKPPAKLGWLLADDAQGHKIVAWLAETRTKFVHLFKGGDGKESLFASITEEVQKDGHVFSVISNISFVPRPEDDKKFLVCVSQHETFSENAETMAVKLELQYAPRIQLRVSGTAPGGEVQLKEGGAALISCDVDAKPNDGLTITWFRNQHEQLRHTTDTLTFSQLKMEDHGTEYTCMATNKIGSSRASTKLDVAFGPRIMSTQQEQDVNPGEIAHFFCEAVGNPTPNIYWTKAGDDQILAKGRNLSIEAVQQWQRGEYVCTATVESFKHATLSHYLNIRGPPSVSVDEEVASALGDSVELICEVRGRPKPHDVIWTVNGEELVYGQGRLQVHQIPRSYGVESRLTIRHLKSADLGVYNCSAENSLGRDSRRVYLKQRSFFAQFWAADFFFAIPILAGILVFLCLATCCFLCRRKKVYSKKKGTKFTASDEQSDVTVKCEALDGQFYPDMYGGPVDNGNVINTKDYISIPQNNPDLDYLPPASYEGGSPYPKYLNHSTDYGATARFDPSYGSFASGVSTPGTMSDMFGLPPERQAPLETLQEILTPEEAAAYPFLSPTHAVSGVDNPRPVSRTSTHV